jgi:uncharacterized protein (DUF1015 family)
VFESRSRHQNQSFVPEPPIARQTKFRVIRLQQPASDKRFSAATATWGRTAAARSRVDAVGNEARAMRVYTSALGGCRGAPRQPIAATITPRPETLAMMHLILAFSGLRLLPERVAEVVAPPYDVLDAEGARAGDKPRSFLHFSRPEIDLPPDTNPCAPVVYAKATENVAPMLAEGILARDPEPGFYVYRLTMGIDVQAGIVAAASIAACDANRIRRHEPMRPDKESDRVRQIEAVTAQTGAVLIAYPLAPQVDAILAEAVHGQPAADVTGDDLILHRLWVLTDAQAIATLTAAFDAMSALYVADDHHRLAAASCVAAARQAANPKHTGEESYDSFLSVAFPTHQMRILDFNRGVEDLNGVAEPVFMSRVAERFAVAASPGAVEPSRPVEFGLYVGGRWYPLNIHPEGTPADPAGSSGVRLLSGHLPGPVPGIQDLRRDDCIDFSGGMRCFPLVWRISSRLSARRLPSHAPEVHMVRTEARRRHGLPCPGLIAPLSRVLMGKSSRRPSLRALGARGPGSIPKRGLRLGRSVPRMLARRTLSS